MDTKACNLTEDEITTLIIHTGSKLGWPNVDFTELMERLNYLHKRLKAFNEQPETKPIATIKPIETAASQAWPT